MIPFILELIYAWMDAAEHRRRAHISRAQQISARLDSASAFSKATMRSGPFLTTRGRPVIRAGFALSDVQNTGSHLLDPCDRSRGKSRRAAFADAIECAAATR
jgi:hypothetical protein